MTKTLCRHSRVRTCVCVAFGIRRESRDWQRVGASPPRLLLSLLPSIRRRPSLSLSLRLSVAALPGGRGGRKWHEWSYLVSQYFNYIFFGGKVPKTLLFLIRRYFNT